MSNNTITRYPRKWERLLDALSQVMSAGFTESDAKQLICNGIADQIIEIQIGLREHITLHTTAHGRRLSGADIDIPVRLKPSDFDFENSRPKKPWPIPRDKNRYLVGYWAIDWIELSRADVTNLIALASSHEKRFAKGSDEKSPHRRRKTQTSREAARRAIAALFPDGVPDQVTVPNAILCHRVGAKMKELELPNVSEDTILRAARRRK
jgi:hypothetical protein